MGLPDRVGFVELFVDIERGRHPTLSDALMSSIRRSADSRLSDVLGILEDTRTAGLGLIMFPGWTLVSDDLPDDVIKAAGNRTVVVETLPHEPRNRAGRKGKSAKEITTKAGKGRGSSEGEVPWRTYVIHRGMTLGPFSQRLITSGQAGSGSTPSPKTHVLKNELEKIRSWSPGSALWICGEVNALYGGGRGKKVVPWINGLPTDWSIVANPAHTPNRLQAMRDKRAHLSKGGVLLTTANIHSSWVDSGGQRQKAGWTAAEVYQRKKPVNLNGTGSNRPMTFKVRDHRVVVIETK